MNLTIGENIKIMRRKCGFTQEELAARLSVTPQAVSNRRMGTEPRILPNWCPCHRFLALLRTLCWEWFLPPMEVPIRKRLWDMRSY